ncbi:unnamed protein product [Rangifer tarandus platyrhynchus]|uniref:Uncharacterized protein n=1 Tax=Rangifer tarandus platyrhynchus TaxID=3082113 RepID=A0AC60A1K1_RANTA
MLCGRMDGRGVWVRMDTCVCMAESLCYLPEIITTLLISYVRAKSLQLCLTLCDPIDCSPPGSSVHGHFSRQENWSGLPCPPPGDLPNPGIKPVSYVSCIGRWVLYY